MASTTLEYLEVIAAKRAEAIVVTTMTAAKVWPRWSPTWADVDYLPSAMSHASDLALGIALAQPQRRVLCINGDGSLLMNLGSLVTMAATSATNLVMFVLANGTYRIVGGAPIPAARMLRWGQLARGCGWSQAVTFSHASQLTNAWPGIVAATGPLLVELEVADPADVPQHLPSRHPGQALRELRTTLQGMAASD